MRPPPTRFAETSSLYREFLAEREELLRHKWHLSEKAGRDVGFERALLHWCHHHRDAWRSGRWRGADGCAIAGLPAAAKFRQSRP